MAGPTIWVLAPPVLRIDGGIAFIAVESGGATFEAAMPVAVLGEALRSFTVQLGAWVDSQPGATPIR